MKRVLVCSIIGFVVAVCLPVSSATADQWPITVPDAGFDDHVLNNVGDYIDISDPAYLGPWNSHSDGAWIDRSYWFSVGDIDDFEAHSGVNKAYADEDYIYQILDETYIEGGTYTLSVWMGQAWGSYDDTYALYFTGEDYTDELIEETGPAGVGDWGLKSLSYTAKASDIGKKIGIKIYGALYVAFDDVTLSYDGPPRPPLATDPIPGDGAEHGSTSVTLGWTPAAEAVEHDVYFGTDLDDVMYATVSEPPVDPYKGRQSGVSYEVTDLVPGTTYYWRIDQVDAGGTAYRGPTWSFWYVSWEAYDPSPPDGALFQDPGVDLSWSGGRAAITHEVLFGTDPGSLTSIYNSGPNTCDPGILLKGTTYYWQVKEHQPEGKTSLGPLWSFSTLPPITNPNLIGWWKLDEGEGTTAFDWSGHGNDGTLIGNPQWAADGMIRGALGFDGDGDYVEIGYSPELSLNDFTVSAWVKIAAEPGVFGVHGTRAGGDTTFDFKVRATDVHGDIGDGNAWIDTAIDIESTHTGTSGQGGDLAVDTWYLITYVIENTKKQVRLYLNTDLKRTIAITGTPLLMKAGQSMRIGHTGTGSEWMNGLIDDVRVYDYALSEAEIVEATSPPEAWNPSPADGAPEASAPITLRWSAGAHASQHQVYFGSSEDSMTLRATLDVGTEEYVPAETADLGHTYYWKVTEVNPGKQGSPWEGDLWSFTVTNYSVDDMESYGNANTPGPPPPAGSRMWYTWKDGWGWTLPSDQGGNGTGAIIGLEPQIVNTGGQSMSYAYDNTATGKDSQENPINVYYSEAVRTFETAQDWTAGGARALTIYFFGDVNNVPSELDRPYVEVNGVKVSFEGDIAALTEEQWHEWNIDLTSFVGVDLQNVTEIILGFGDENNATTPGSDGVVYFDDIRLYPTRCVAAERDAAFAVFDFVGEDCRVNYREFELMAANWLRPIILPVTIVNPGFEDPVLGEDDYTWQDVPGWTPIGDEGIGIWNTTIADFDPVIAPEGENVLYNEYTVGFAGGVAQVLPETFAANTDYTLTVEVGNSWYYYFSGYKVQLLAGGTVIAEDNDTLWPAYYEWATSTVEYTYNPADAILVGQPLEIRLLSLGLDKDNPGGEVIGVEFDNVRLVPSSEAPADPRANLYKDTQIDFKDFAELAVWWLDEQLWP